MYTIEPQLLFRTLIKVFKWYEQNNPLFPNLPDKPHFNFGNEDVVQSVMGNKYNGVKLLRNYSDKIRPLYYQTYINGDNFYLQIDNITYKVLSIATGTCNNAKMELQSEDSTEVTFWGYKGNFEDSIFKENSLTGLNA